MTDAGLAARVAQLEHALEERRRGEDLQRALYEIASLSAADRPEHEHYARLHAIVGRLMYARNFIIATFDADSGMVRQEYLVDEDPDEVAESFPYGEGISSLVIRTRKPWLLDDAQFRALVDIGEIRAPRGLADFNSWMGVPLIAQDRVYGLIIVQSYSEDVTYTEQDLELLNFVASQVAVTVARWQSNEELAAANAELAQSTQTLRMVGDIGMDLTGSLDVRAICQTLERHFTALMPTDAFGVALLTPAGDELEYVYYVEDGIEDTGTRFALDHPTSLAAATMREDRELTLYNEELDAAPDPENFSPSAPILSAVFRPLLVAGRRIGVVTVQSHHADAYQAPQLEVFRSAAAFAAIALANADAYAVAEKARRETAQALVERNQAEAHLVHSEKMAALGQLIAGVAHEINTPIGAIKSSGRNISEAIGGSLLALPALLERLDEPHRVLFGDLVARASEPRPALSTREERVIVRELTARLEELGFTHPRHRAGLLVQLQAHHDLDEVLPLLRHEASEAVLETAHGIATITTNADNINTAVDRVAKIIFALKSFSRFGGVQVWTDANLVDGVETVLTIYQNQIKHGTELVRRYDPDVPPVRCLPDELNQVWTNLVHNALQAMENKGTLTVGLRREGNDVLVMIGDTGCGIPEDIRARIFDAFFTTKPAGEGTGLGLDIVRKIIDKHHGCIDVASEVGVGTTFSIRLPIAGVS